MKCEDKDCNEFSRTPVKILTATLGGTLDQRSCFKQ